MGVWGGVTVWGVFLLFVLVLLNLRTALSSICRAEDIKKKKDKYPNFVLSFLFCFVFCFFAFFVLFFFFFPLSGEPASYSLTFFPLISGQNFQHCTLSPLPLSLSLCTSKKDLTMLCNNPLRSWRHKLCPPAAFFSSGQTNPFLPASPVMSSASSPWPLSDLSLDFLVWQHLPFTGKAKTRCSTSNLTRGLVCAEQRGIISLLAALLLL